MIVASFIVWKGDHTVEILENPTQLSGEDILSDFILNLMGILGG